jgi:N-methylhydantoinase A
MSDAIRRVLALAGVDPRDLDLVAFGGMGAVQATTQDAELGIRRVLVPGAAPAFSALGLVTADHVVDEVEAHVAPWKEADLDALSAHGRMLVARADAQLSRAGVPESQRRYEWLLNLVYPGQTFDVAIPIAVTSDGSVTAVAVHDSVEEFHRRNEAARLIEARSQEPMIRGIRLVATGAVTRPEAVALEPIAAAPEPVAHRGLFAGDRWHDDAPVYDASTLRPGPSITGPAVLQSAFTSVVLRDGDVARMLAHGDLLIDVAR